MPVRSVLAALFYILHNEDGVFVEACVGCRERSAPHRSRSALAIPSPQMTGKMPVALNSQGHEFRIRPGTCEGLYRAGTAGQASSGTRLKTNRDIRSLGYRVPKKNPL